MAQGTLVHYRPKYFQLQELVDRAAYTALGERAWQLLDPRLLWTLDQLRELYGPVICNTWHQGGTLQGRGLRSPQSTVGAAWSQHRLGRAMDMHFGQVSVEAVRREILTQPEREAYRYITAVERDTSWLHIDCRNWDRDARGVLVFNP